MNNWYYTHVNATSWSRCITLLVPFVGNFIVCREAEEGNRLYELAEEYNRCSHESSAVSQELYKMAARLGHAESLFKLGSIEDMLVAAEKGHVGAMLHVAKWWESYDCDDAEKWYRRAADEGDVTAMFRLGKLYEERKIRGGSLDDIRAAEWYEKAAMGGNLDAALRLKQLHEEGKVKSHLIARLDLMAKWAEKIAGDSPNP